jgi:hypothetical protein
MGGAAGYARERSVLSLRFMAKAMTEERAKSKTGATGARSVLAS